MVTAFNESSTEYLFSPISKSHLGDSREDLLNLLFCVSISADFSAG